MIPLQDRVIVRRKEQSEKTPGGLFIPDNAKEKPIEGEVLCAGEGRILENGVVRPLDVRAGDVVLFSEFAGTEIRINGEPVLMLREDDLLARYER